MSDNRPKTAFITGGASGIGRALSERLVSQGWHIFIADISLSSMQSLVSHLNTTAGNNIAHYAETDVSSWTSQLAAFQQAVKVFNNRIDLVAPIAGIGERKWIPFPKECAEMGEGEFKEPDLTVLDVDLRGVMFTVALAVQQFRKQEAVALSGSSDDGGKRWRGKIAVVSSVCGLYAVPSVPVYTAAKHGVVGLVRSYGQLLPEEKIALSAVCPCIVRTGISTSDFYEKVAKEGLLVPMETMISAFDDILTGGGSGDIYECSPKGEWVKRPGYEYLDTQTERSAEVVRERAWPLHYPSDGQWPTRVE